jgi:hypothetical protein
VTQWGTDPAFAGDLIASPFTPLPKHFPNARSTEFELDSDGITLGETSTYRYAHATFDVAFEPPDPSEPERPADPGRDPHNGRWYCDIDIDPGTPYFPFIRLALVRFQPSGQFSDPDGLIFFDMRFSRVTLVDFVQLAPDRTLNIVPEPADPTTLHVTVTGPSFTPNEALGNLTRVPPTVAVGVEMNVGGTAAPLWIPMSSTEFDPAAPTGPGATAWTGDVRLPYAQGSKPMRLTVKEYETLPADPPDRTLAGTALLRRIVFATSAELSSPSYSFATVDFLGAASTLLNGISDAGEIVGQQLDTNGVLHSMRTDTRAFETFDPPGFTGKSYPGISFANGLNDNGDIVGGVENNDNAGQQAYVRSGDAYTLYSHPSAGPSGTTVFQGVNNAGVRVGSYAGNDSIPHGIIQTGDATTLLEDLPNVPPNAGTFIFDINNAGQMVGGYFDASQDIQYGFVTDGNTFTTIDVKGGSTTWLNGINDRGVMVGGYFDDATQLWHGFVTDGKTVATLDFPGAPGQRLGTFLTGIDNAGRIVGYCGDDIDHQNRAGIHGFIAMPVSGAVP